MSSIRYLTDRDVAHRYGTSRVTPWRWARAGIIPPPVKIGPSTTRWVESELDAWDFKKAAKRRSAR
jgi:prophage regulatory protein